MAQETQENEVQGGDNGEKPSRMSVMVEEARISTLLSVAVSFGICLNSYIVYNYVYYSWMGILSYVVVALLPKDKQFLNMIPNVENYVEALQRVTQGYLTASGIFFICKKCYPTTKWPLQMIQPFNVSFPSISATTLPYVNYYGKEHQDYDATTFLLITLLTIAIINVTRGFQVSLQIILHNYSEQIYYIKSFLIIISIIVLAFHGVPFVSTKFY